MPALGTNSTQNLGRRIYRWLFSFSVLFQAHTMLPNPFCSSNFTAVKPLEFFPPPAAHGRCTSQRWNTRHRFWQGKRETVLFFQGFFFPLLWIHSVNYEALWPLRVSAERGKRLTHVWRGGGWSFPLLCVHRHLISELHGVFWPRRALGRCLFASSQGSR